MSYGSTYFMVLKSTMCCWILTQILWSGREDRELQLLFGGQAYIK